MKTKKAPGFTDKPREKQGKRRNAAEGGSRKERPRRPATEIYLERAGLYYLQRFASSVENFKTVMRRKVRRRGLADGVEEATAEAWIDALAARFERVELLDDTVFAEGRARSLFRRGKSQRVIRQTLLHKGVPADVTDTAFEVIFGDVRDPDLHAAVAFARRRRFGPFRKGAHADLAPDPDVERRVLGAFARAGFSYGVARRVLEAESQAAAEALLEE